MTATPEQVSHYQELAREAGHKNPRQRSYSPCHPDCGPIIRWSDSLEQHAHENDDGVCWHDNEDA